MVTLTVLHLLWVGGVLGTITKALLMVVVVIVARHFFTQRPAMTALLSVTRGKNLPRLAPENEYQHNKLYFLAPHTTTFDDDFQAIFFLCGVRDFSFFKNKNNK